MLATGYRLDVGTAQLRHAHALDECRGCSASRAGVAARGLPYASVHDADGVRRNMAGMTTGERAPSESRFPDLCAMLGKPLIAAWLTRDLEPDPA